MAPVLATARKLLADEPRSGTALRAALATRFPELDASALAYACRNLIPLVQVPPRGVWRRSGQVRSTPLEHWIADLTAAWSGIVAALTPALAGAVVGVLAGGVAVLVVSLLRKLRSAARSAPESEPPRA